MKTKPLYLLFMVLFICSCDSNKKQDKQGTTEPNNTLVGKWVRMGQTGPISLDFKENGIVEGDFGNDQTVDIVAKYVFSGDTIKFIDTDGKMCQGTGKYKVYQTKYYVSFDLVDDDCGGRIKATMGFWTKPNYPDFLQTLDKEIANAPNADSYLSRARIYLATGMPNKARDDFDHYLSTDSLDANVFVNRAGTRFPSDLPGVVSDCSKAISLDPNHKNAYFLRGLARYELGEKMQGCEDFSRAIELGFSVLRMAEHERCSDFWGKQ
jgi:hypothetical protein